MTWLPVRALLLCQAPEGSFMSPALGGALVLTGMLLRTVLFSGDSSPF